MLLAWSAPAAPLPHAVCMQVVHRASSMQVTLASNKKYKAVIKGQEPDKDLAGNVRVSGSGGDAGMCLIRWAGAAAYL